MKQESSLATAAAAIFEFFLKEMLLTFLEENLSPKSDIDAIMDHFEDAYFYGDSNESDRVIEANLVDNTVKEQLTISEIR